MGPMVWELLGPMPMEKISNKLVYMANEFYCTHCTQMPVICKRILLHLTQFGGLLAAMIFVGRICLKGGMQTAVCGLAACRIVHHVSFACLFNSLIQKIHRCGVPQRW